MDIIEKVEFNGVDKTPKDIINENNFQTFPDSQNNEITYSGVSRGDVNYPDEIIIQIDFKPELKIEPVVIVHEIKIENKKDSRYEVIEVPYKPSKFTKE